MASSTKKSHAEAEWRGWRRLKMFLARWRPALNLTLAAGMLVQAGGCSRWFYRSQADDEVGEILAQKDKYTDWRIDNWHVYPDPRARFADPSDPDHPPMPPDDPAMVAMSPNPQKPGKAGVARIEGKGYLELIAKWDQENRKKREEDELKKLNAEAEPPGEEEEEGLNEENRQPLAAAEKAVTKPGPLFNQVVSFQKAAPDNPPAEASQMKAPPTQPDAIAAARERSLLDITDRPSYLLTLDQVAELAMFNSREYQDQRETLYLAALPVTQERFAFMAQFFAGEEAVRAYTGRETATGQTSNWALNNGTGFSKILPTGALLLLNFSNQTVFDFLNPKNTLSVTDLNFTAIQPLLRGGGEAVALESLTQAERNLLYAIRNYARFRKELYVEVASNNGGSVSGSAFQPTGTLPSFTGVPVTGPSSSGTIPGVIPPAFTTISTPIVPPTSPGFLNLTPAITPPPSGYLNTMLQKITVYIDQENIDVLVDILQRFRGLQEGDQVQPLQVQGVEQQLLSGRYTQLGDQQNYLQSLDAFKIAIGVPVQLNIEMDDSVLRPLINQFRKARAIIDNEHLAVTEAAALIPIEKAPVLRAELLRLFTKSALVKETPFAKTIRRRWAEWEKMSTKDLDSRLDNLRKDAKDLLDREAELQKKGQALSPEERARLHSINSQIDLGSFERAVRVYEANYVDMGKPKKPDPAGERQRIRQFQNVMSNWQKVLVEARDDQWDAIRASWPELPPACLEGIDLVHAPLAQAQAEAFQYTLLHRLDLMNVRGAVVDAWRQIAVYANALLGMFTVEYNLNASSPAGAAQPLNIGGSGNAHQLILNTQLPLVRIVERNNYRAAQIAYQKQRRALQEAEDLSVQAVNFELTNLRQYAEQYKIQQRQIELAYLTIDNSLEALQAPTPPAPPPGLTRSQQDGPAALTQQLLASQRSLPAAQTGMLTVWINYLDQRLQLYRDLEYMPLDERGVWIDKIKECDCQMTGGQPLPGPQLEPVPTLPKPPPSEIGPPVPPNPPRVPPK